MIAEAATAAVNPWAQFGLAGVVIGSLFFVLIVIVRWLISHIDKQAATHKQERGEWKADSNERSKEFQATVEKTVTEFSATIKELARR